MKQVIFTIKYSDFDLDEEVCTFEFVQCGITAECILNTDCIFVDPPTGGNDVGGGFIIVDPVVKLIMTSTETNHCDLTSKIWTL